MLLGSLLFASSCGDELEPDSLRENDERYLDQLQAAMIEHLWGEAGLPDWEPLHAVMDTSDPMYDGLANLGRMDLLVLDLGYGLTSSVYHFHPEQGSNNRLIIYHQGHAGRITAGWRTLEHFLSRGYSVLGFAMPLLGPNDVPAATLPSGQRILLGIAHGDLEPFEDEGVETATFFAEPVVVGLNYIEANYDYDSIDMIGLSGGGWTTSLVAAIDFRIERSYPVAGGLPFYLRTSDSQDFEQVWDRSFFRVATYLDWYALGGRGEGRRQMQVLNLNDPCCFWGAGRETEIQEYAADIRALGSDFEVFIDDQPVNHEISLNALNVIEADMAR